jgi:hypothetical protein
MHFLLISSLLGVGSGRRLPARVVLFVCAFWLRWRLRFRGHLLPRGDCILGCYINVYRLTTPPPIVRCQVCVYDAMCANRNAMWALNAGDPWHCELDYWGFKEFFEKILNTPSEEVAAMDLKWAFPTGPRKEERQQQRQWADDDGW